MPGTKRSTKAFDIALGGMIENTHRSARIATLDEVLGAIKDLQADASGEKRILLGQVRKKIAGLKHDQASQ